MRNLLAILAVLSLPALSVAAPQQTPTEYRDAAFIKCMAAVPEYEVANASTKVIEACLAEANKATVKKFKK